MAKQVWIENGIIVFYGNRAGYVRRDMRWQTLYSTRRSWRCF